LGHFTAAEFAGGNEPLALAGHKRDAKQEAAGRGDLPLMPERTVREIPNWMPLLSLS